VTEEKRMNTPARILALAAALAFALAAPLRVAATEPEPAAKPAAQHAAKAAEPCATTGTRIQRKDGSCSAFAPFRSYTQKDLQTTGASTMAEALRRLDPIFLY
jgi:hypothetical protein